MKEVPLELIENKKSIVKEFNTVCPFCHRLCTADISMITLEVEEIHSCNHMKKINMLVTYDVQEDVSNITFTAVFEKGE